MHLQKKTNRLGDPVKKGEFGKVIFSSAKGVLRVGPFPSPRFGLSPEQIWYCGKKKVHPHPFLFVGTHG
jgi:hypothetical protein